MDEHCLRQAIELADISVERREEVQGLKTLPKLLLELFESLLKVIRMLNADPGKFKRALREFMKAKESNNTSNVSDNSIR